MAIDPLRPSVGVGGSQMPVLCACFTGKKAARFPATCCDDDLSASRETPHNPSTFLHNPSIFPHNPSTFLHNPSGRRPMQAVLWASLLRSIPFYARADNLTD